MRSEIEARAKFDSIRYSQVWEDADLLIEALDLCESDIVLSIASAGDNAFALLAQNPTKVYAVDISFSQIACCELRKAMYQQLTYDEHLRFGGVLRGDVDRLAIFNKLNLPPEIREYWENNITVIKNGFMAHGKFEHYFELLRKKLLPLIHPRRRVDELIAPKSENERKTFYDEVWNNRRWRIMFRLFFSRYVMGRFGRDKEFFKFVEGSVSNKILSRVKHALSEMDTSQNPYLHFITHGEYTMVFPYSLREENYHKIRNNLAKIEFRNESVEEFMSEFSGTISAFNLSDIFEYMTQEGMDKLYGEMLKKATCGANFIYWNMLAPRECSDVMRAEYGVKTCAKRNAEFLMKDKAFFYSKFYLDTVSASGASHAVSGK